MTQVQDRSVTEVRTTTNDVLQNHLKCFGEGDLEGILSDYAPGCVLFTADGPLRREGRDPIAVHGDACRVRQAGRRLQHEAAVC